MLKNPTCQSRVFGLPMIVYLINLDNTISTRPMGGAMPAMTYLSLLRLCTATPKTDNVRFARNGATGRLILFI